MVLKGTNSGDVIGVERVDQGADTDHYVPRPTAVTGQLVPSRRVQEHVDVVVLIHHHRRYVPPVGLREREPGRLAEVEDCEAVQGIPVQADDGLLVDRCRLPIVPKHADPARVALEVGEHPVRLRPDEVIGIDHHRHVRLSRQQFLIVAAQTIN